MTSVAFDAVVVSAHDPDEGLFLVGFSDSPVDPSRYLLLQRSLDPHEQDCSLGHDTYHVEWCGQENSLYGGIEEFSLGDTVAHIRFAPHASGSLDGLSELAITFTLSAGDLNALQRGLEVIFAGSGCFVRANA
jgi:hypothetical protein